jgi:UDP-N-acetylmuramoylalanine--D-glutamate ligase
MPGADYKNKKVAVVGLARSGIAAANLLKDLGAEVFATDSGSGAALTAQAQDLRGRGISVELGGHTLDFIRNKDLVVVSPGVNNKSQALIWAGQLRIPVISEIELAWSVCPAKVIAITGTNGKTTVTALTAEVLRAKGSRAFALGNIGRPFSQEVVNLAGDDFVSLEVSSFQLERIDKFRPKVSVILNFRPDHLDRYKDMPEYLEAKKRIFMNQDKDDYLVLNDDDSVVRDLAKEAKARVSYFGGHQGEESSGKAPFNLNPNHLAVMAIAGIFGVSGGECLEVFKNFKGVEHRLEQVRSVREIEFINDSKATNVDSTAWALRNIRKPAILIAGGRDKNSDYREISGLIKQKVKLLVVIGEAKEKIRSQLKESAVIQDASSLEEAVSVSFRQARSGDCVLLSPMCASFDMFKDYEHRGRVFKEIVSKL